MVEIKRRHWMALIGLLAVLNLVVLAGLVMLVIGFVPWHAVGRGTLRSASPWATARATLRPTFTPTATPAVWPVNTAPRLATTVAWPSATWTPPASRTPWPAAAKEDDPDVTPTPVQPTRTRVPTRTPRAANTWLNEPHPQGQPAGQVTLNTTWSASSEQAVAQPTCNAPTDGRPCGGWETLPADRKVTLSWRPVAKSVAYRIYSDMGTGYGVYVFKAETEQTAFSDSQLRAGWRYDYRVQPVVRTGKKQLISLARSQWVAIIAIMSNQPAGITRESDYAAIVLAN